MTDDRLIRNEEDLSEEPVSFEEWTPWNPCPNCGGIELLATRETDEVVILESRDDDGIHIDPQGSGTVLKVWCRKCDELIYEDDP